MIHQEKSLNFDGAQFFQTNQSISKPIVPKECALYAGAQE
jgi:hypothetical protein